MPYTREQIRAKFKELPEELQEAYLSVDISDKLAAIARANGLTIDKAGVLGDEVGAVILGFTKAHDFVSNLKKGLDAPAEAVEKIASEINKEIFSDIRAAFQRASTDNSDADGSERQSIIDKIEEKEVMPLDPFVEKMKPDGHVMPKRPAEDRYGGNDPYREAVD